MVAFKYTFLFDWQSRAGWTETFYKETASSTGQQIAGINADSWAAARARCLTAAASIIAVRVTPTNDPRNTTLFSIKKKGALGQGLILNNISPDVVNDAQLTTLTSTSGVKRQYLIRGMDDNDIENGLITYGANGIAVMNRFLNFLVNQGWAMRDFVSSGQVAMTALDGATGIVTCDPIAGLGVGDIVVVNGRHVGNGKKVRWQGKVKTFGAGTITLKGYKFGSLAGPGTIEKITANYPTFQSHFEPDPNWARTRQTGRPFNLPRGRAPKKT